MIAGTAKRSKLKVPRGIKVRPTSDRVKEALFNILGNLVPDSLFLDLYAGTGSIGIEALSRGAGSAVLVEKDIKNIRVIRDNLTITGLGHRARVINLDVTRAMPLLGGEKQSFSIVFMDPPYSKDMETATLEGILKWGLLKAGGVVVVEGSSKANMPGIVNNLVLIRQEKYGDTTLYIYKENAGEGNQA